MISYQRSTIQSWRWCALLPYGSAGSADRGSRLGAEKIVQASGTEVTVLRCSWFTQNFTEGSFLPDVLSGAVALPVGDAREPFLDADDIADAAVTALLEDGHAGRVYELTGPRLMTFQEAIAEIALQVGARSPSARCPCRSTPPCSVSSAYRLAKWRCWNTSSASCWTDAMSQ
jgi:nucleoside-diphosphate-sugar epimerase